MYSIQSNRLLVVRVTDESVNMIVAATFSTPGPVIDTDGEALTTALDRPKHLPQQQGAALTRDVRQHRGTPLERERQWVLER